MTKNNQRKLHRYTRAVIQLLFFLFLPSIYTSAFSGIKQIFTNLGSGKAVELSAFLTIFLMISVYTVIFGRFFCGYACAFGALGDGVRALYVWICKKGKRKPLTIPDRAADMLSYGKYIVLLAIVCLCFSGVYGSLTGWNPWDVFSMTIAGNFAYATYKLGVVLLLLILVLMAVSERGFCRFLCPMGAWFALLPVLPFFAIKRDREACLPKCKACKVVCPSRLDIPQQKSWDFKGDCFACGKCIDICPKSHVGSGWFQKLKGNETILTVVRAVLLVLVMLWAGV